MAVRAAVVTGPDDNGVVTVTWAGLRNGDTGSPVQMARYADKTANVVVVAAGVGDALLMEGANVAGGTFGGLHDPQGTLLNAAGGFVGATIADLLVISENPFELRPSVTAGDGTTDLTCVVTMSSRGK